MIGKYFRKFLKKNKNSQQVKASQQTTKKKQGISRDNISINALKVLSRLQEAGFPAYLVGGSVRDLLLGRLPKDFDIATNALPEQIVGLFRNSRLIGRRFRLVHVYFRDEIIEVSTFRANTQENDTDGENQEMPAMLKSENIYGTIEEDAWRRDFTVNALYYNAVDGRVEDYVNGMPDLERAELRMIGDPVQRYHEDPVRLLRAIRLAAKLNFVVHADTEKPMREQAHLLQHVPPARLLDEIFKLFFEGNAEVTFEKLLHYGYIELLFPASYGAMHHALQPTAQNLIILAMQQTDRRFTEGLSLNPSFLFAVLLWPALQINLQQLMQQGNKFHTVYHQAVHQTISNQLATVMIPKRLIAMIRSIWLLQYQLTRLRSNRVMRSAAHRYFRAAVDFLELREQSGEPLEVVKWWKKFRYADDRKRDQMIKSLDRKK